MAWFELWWPPLFSFLSSFTNRVTQTARILHGRWNIRFMSPLRLQTERSHFDTCAPLSPAGKGRCVFWGSLLQLIPSKHTSSHTPSLLGQCQPYNLPVCPVDRWQDQVKTAKEEGKRKKKYTAAKFEVSLKKGRKKSFYFSRVVWLLVLVTQEALFGLKHSPQSSASLLNHNIEFPPLRNLLWCPSQIEISFLKRRKIRIKKKRFALEKFAKNHQTL